MASLNKTPLFDYHFEVDAKMVPVGSWTMPFQFGDGFKNEYIHASEGACIIDFCCANIYRLTGKNFEKMHAIAPAVQVGEGGFVCWQEDGKLVDTPFAIRMAEEDFLCSFAPSAKVVCSKKFESGELQDLSEVFGSIAIFGTETLEILAELKVDIENWQVGTFQKIEIDSVRCIAVRTEIANGEFPCVMLFFDREKSDDVWIALFNTPGVWATGVGAWNLCRLQEVLPPYNTLNCALPLLLGRWNGRKIPQPGATVVWSAENAEQQAQVIYSSQVPHAADGFLLFSGKFAENSVLKCPANTDESGVVSDFCRLIC